MSDYNFCLWILKNCLIDETVLFVLFVCFFIDKEEKGTSVKEKPVLVTPERVELANCMSKAVSIAKPKRSEGNGGQAVKPKVSQSSHE